MKVKLFFPPHFSIFQPYLSLPALKAFLKEKGFFISQEDLNLSSFYYFMQSAYLQRCVNKSHTIIEYYEKKKTLSKNYQKHYDVLYKALLSAPLVIPNIDNAIEFFHNREKFLEFEEYILQERIIQQAMQIVSAAYFPTHISLVDFLMDYSPESSNDIFNAIEDEETNLYIPYFKKHVANNLSMDKPDLIGISITAMSQVIPGLTLANIIKQNLPDVKIVIGGVIPNHLSSKIKALPKLFTLFNYLIIGEGETPLYKLCESLSGKLSIESVPNLIYLKDGSIYETAHISFEEVNRLPTPDYDGFPLEKYLSPLPVLSVEPARGCYWRKCIFCNQYSIHGNTFRLREPRFIIHDIKTLREKYGSQLFNISNEGVPAGHLYRISEAILEHGLNIQWYAGAQIKKAFSKKVCYLLKKAGCRKLIFGLESGSQRVLNIMKKGIVLDDVTHVLQNCKNVGVDVHLYLMIGFPTETLKEIEGTQNFVLKILPNVNKEGFTFYISVFQPMVESPIINQLSQFGYEAIPRSKNYDLTYIFEHLPTNERLSRFSRKQLEEISNNMSSIIYSHLPPQSIPEEFTHYMCYLLWSCNMRRMEIEKVSSKYENMESSWKVLVKSRRYIKKSRWISLRNIKFVNNSLSSSKRENMIAYNLLRDKYYLLNESAANYLNSNRILRKAVQYLNGAKQHYNLNKKDDIKSCLVYLLKENFIEIERRQGEGKDEIKK